MSLPSPDSNGTVLINAITSCKVEPQPLLEHSHSQSDDEYRSGRSTGDACKNSGSSTTSTLATPMPSSLPSPEHRLASLLKASPPHPIGRVPGRYRVQLWRASLAQPFGIGLITAESGIGVCISTDAVHLGLRKGDEVLNMNQKRVNSVSDCNHLMANSHSLEMQLHHREGQVETRFEDACALCGNIPESMNSPVCCDMCLNPPEPKCRAHSWPLRDMLLTSGPIPLDDNGTFSLQIIRMSQQQPFGLVFALSSPDNKATETMSRSSAKPSCGSESTTASWGDRPDTPSVTNDTASIPDIGVDAATAGQQLFIKGNLQQFGLMDGDQLMQINGVPINEVEVCKDMLKNAMTLTLDFRRKEGNGDGDLWTTVTSFKPSTGQQQGKPKTWFDIITRSLTALSCCAATGPPGEYMQYELASGNWMPEKDAPVAALVQLRSKA